MRLTNWTAVWDDFLLNLLPFEDQCWQSQAALGARLLLGEASSFCMFIIYGPRGSGKNQLMDALRAALGDGKVLQMDSSQLKEMDAGAYTNAQRIPGAAALWVDEMKLHKNGNLQTDTRSMYLIITNEPITTGCMKEMPLLEAIRLVMATTGIGVPDEGKIGEEIHRRLSPICAVDSRKGGPLIKKFGTTMGTEGGHVIAAWIAQGASNYARDPTLVGRPITSWFCFRPWQSQEAASNAVTFTGGSEDYVSLADLLDDCMIKVPATRKRLMAMAQHASFVKEVEGVTCVFGYVRS